jgi:hypothetical protein
LASGGIVVGANVTPVWKFVKRGLQFRALALLLGAKADRASEPA